MKTSGIARNVIWNDNYGMANNCSRMQQVGSWNGIVFQPSYFSGMGSRFPLFLNRHEHGM